MDKFRARVTPWEMLAVALVVTFGTGHASLFGGRTLDFYTRQLEWIVPPLFIWGAVLFVARRRKLAESGSNALLVRLTAPLALVLLLELWPALQFPGLFTLTEVMHSVTDSLPWALLGSVAYPLMTILPGVSVRGAEVGLSADGRRLVGGRGMYTIYTATGVVGGTTKGHSTEVIDTRSSHTEYYTTSSGYQTSRVVSTGGVSSVEHVHDQFFLTGSDGREVPIQLTDWDVPIRDGHLVSLAWAIPDGKDRGPYLLLNNHSLSRTWWHDRVIREILELRWGLLGPVITIGIPLIAVTIAALANTTTYDWDEPTLSDEGFAVVLLMSFVWAAGAGIALSWIKRSVNRGRLPHFKGEGSRPLQLMLDAAAQGAMAGTPGVATNALPSITGAGD